MQNNDELANLWQTQPTQKVDVEAVKKSFHQETTKQRRYFILDCLAMLPGAILLFTYWAEFSLLAKVMIGGIFLLSYPIDVLGRVFVISQSYDWGDFSS